MEFNSLKDLSRDVYNTLYPKESLDGIPVELTRLRELTGPVLKNGGLHVIGGRPGMGKTALMLQLAKDAADQGTPVYIFNNERDKDELLTRLLAMCSGVQIVLLDKAIKTAKRASWFSRLSAERIRSTLIRFSGLPINICTYYCSAEDIAEFCSALTEGCVFIDSFQMLRGISDDGTAEAESLKKAALDGNIPIVVTSEMRQAVDGRDDRRPGAGDLLRADGLAESADIIITLYREGYYDRKAKDDSAEFLVAKGGLEIGTAFVSWNRAAWIFEDRDRQMKYDELDFRQMPLSGEDGGAGIYINGRELVDIIIPIEDHLIGAGDKCAPGEYSHLPADMLYKELSDAAVPGTYAYNDGAYLTCCLICESCSCWSLLAHVKTTEDEVIWTLSHNHRNWDYGVQFCFEKTQYEAALNRLREM